VTPEDNGCILPNFIRNTILELKDEIENETSMVARERPISIHEIVNANDEGRLIEAFGCSTASLIQPIHKIVHRNRSIALSTDKENFYSNYLNRKIVDMMKGPDSHPWVTSLED
jgi:branched-chain amino acid aminotransferase